jgi:hypothetical protein
MIDRFISTRKAQPMRKAKGNVLARAKHAVRAIFPSRWRRTTGWHWFDHPEMQARIDEAEADRREGRVARMDTPEAVDTYLNSLA